jgi:hypothetical protein
MIAAGINTGMHLENDRNLESEIMSSEICILIGLFLIRKGTTRK